MSEHEVELTEIERKVLTTLGNIRQIGLTDADEDGICYGVVINSEADRLARAVAAIVAARLADAEARASRVAEIVARIEDDPRYDDSFGAAGLLNLRDDLREALRGDQ